MTAGTREVRAHLLALLLAEPGAFVSGEAVSGALNMTRAAVWKHMQALEQEGWPIESLPRRGYRLSEAQPYPYAAAAISALLRDMGESFPWRIVLEDEVDSTSSRLKEMAAAGEPEGTVLIAETQTGGRGRMGRQWASQRGRGIWMSVLLRPPLAPGQVQTLTLAAAVAVVEALRDTLAEQAESAAFPAADIPEALAAACGVKWPNDVLWQGKKLCGILTELAAEPDRLSHVVIGIGLNVSHRAEDFPEPLRQTAASVSQLLRAAGIEAPPNRNRLCAHLLHRLAGAYGELLAGRLPTILARWRQMSVTLGSDIQVLAPEGARHARAVDIGEDGRLLVAYPDGRQEWLLSGEISIRSS